MEIVAGKYCNFSTYLAKRARAQSGSCAEVQFPEYGTVLWAPSSRNYSRKHCEFSTYLAKRARAQSGSFAEVQFLEYGTVLWACYSRNMSRKALQYQHLSCQERELSLAHVQRCSFLIMEQCYGSLAVENFPGKHCVFSTYFAKKARAQFGGCAHVQFPDYGTVLWSPGSKNC
jgi:hypothetical protein